MQKNDTSKFAEFESLRDYHFRLIRISDITKINMKC